MREHLTEKYRLAPDKPGVYLMKDKNGTVIYVGKAANIKKRLAAYFVSDRHDLKTAVLLKKVHDFDTVVTSSDHEAYILESNLIKEHAPRYNVILKDGKNYPYLRINTREPYPAIRVVRRIKNDGALYFGPYSSTYSVRQTLKQIHRIFRLRKCTNNQFKNRSRPCLNYQIKACFGPCCNDVTREEYRKVVRDVSLFLKGRAKKVKERLEAEMKQHAENRDFEKAVEVRDTLFAVRRTLEKQYVVSPDLADRDVIACAGDDASAVVTVLNVRSGYLVDTAHFEFDLEKNTPAEVMEAFVTQYYEKVLFIPAEILIARPLENAEAAEHVFSERKGRRVNIRVPRRGDKKKLVDMGLANAGQKLEKIAARQAETVQILSELKEFLRMGAMPGRIECFDNSHIGGSHPVSSMVVFQDAAPDRDAYRKYILRDTGPGDDYAGMKEVLTRRYRRDEMPFPDLLLVDGGKGQLSMAMAVLAELGISGAFTVAGIAKKDADKGETQDKIYIPGRSNPLNPAKAPKGLKLLERVRNEAHRTAVAFQRKRHDKAAGASALDEVPHIGQKRKQILLTYYKSVDNIRNASRAELAALPGMNAKAAESLAEWQKSQG